MYISGQDFLDDYPTLLPDIVFIDIEMPIMNGFEVLHRLTALGTRQFPKIVFVTAFEEYAVKAFEINALDYVVKPVTQERLKNTMDRILTELRSESAEPLLKDIYLRCFGHFEILSQGREGSFKWRTKKAEEMLIYLIVQQGKFVSKEKIIDALWPELDSEKGSSNLYITYYYIKQALAQSRLGLSIESRLGRMRLLMDELDCDIMQFEELSAKIKRSGEKEKAKYLEQLCSLYQGTLFDDYYFEWLGFEQRQYELRFAKYCRELCSHLKTDDPENYQYFANILAKYLK